MIALILLTLFGLATLWLILFVPIFAPVPTGRILSGPLPANRQVPLVMHVHTSTPTCPKLARSISLGLLLAVQWSVMKI